MTLAGAFALIMNKNIPGANKLLGRIDDIKDIHAKYIGKLVELNLAIAKKDDIRKKKVLLELRDAPVLTDLLNKISDAAESGNFETVRRVTAHCFLAAAA